ncbi:MAG: hypothetical protein PHU21_07675 [Elusimicrobia bacterium]|nr:hypothetical protein [Elusimicrobiota bacterium]
MKGRFSAVSLLSVSVCLLGAGTASAANMTSAQVPTRAGVTGPTVLAPVNSGGPSLQSGLGNIDLTKGTLQNLPGVTSLLPSAKKSGAVKSAADFFSDLGLPAVKMNLRQDAAPPSLPGSLIPGADETQAAYNSMNPASPAAFAVETMSEYGLTKPQPARRDLPDGTLKPGPGGGMTALTRSASKLAAKSEAVGAQLRAAAQPGALATPENAQGLGVRLMNILTDERGQDGSNPKLASGVRGAQADPWLSAPSGARPLAAAAQPGGRSLGGGWVYDVPAMSGGYWLAYRQSVGPGASAASSEGGMGGVALLALQVSRQSLILSVVDAPARGLALRLAEDSALAMVERVPAAFVAAEAMGASQLRDAVASPSLAPRPVPLPLGPQVQEAQTEVFSFLQTAGDGPAADEPGAGLSRRPSRPGSAAPLRAPVPASFPDPLLAASLLPLLGLLIVRSRLFS